RISAASGTSISLKLSDGTVLGLHTDANSAVSLEGIAITNPAALLNRKAKAIYEPSTFLILSLAAEANSMRGRITAVDTAAKTLTVTAAKARTMKLDAAANITRNGQTATLADMVVGDHAHVAYIHTRAGFRALAIHA